MLRLLVTTQDSIPQFRRIVEDWQALLKLVDKKASHSANNPYTKRRTLLVWELVDKSLPVPIKDEVWFIRILHHKIDGLCLDVRKVKKIETELNTSYQPTDIGIVLPLKDWLRLLDPIFKLLKKWKGK